MITINYNDFVNENKEFANTSKGKSFIQEVIKFLSEKHEKSLEEAKKIVENYLDEIGDYFILGVSAKTVARKLFQETNIEPLDESMFN